MIVSITDRGAPSYAPRSQPKKEEAMSTLLLIIVLLVVLGGLPQVSRHNYGYGPSGLGGVILLILLILLLTGRL